MNHLGERKEGDWVRGGRGRGGARRVDMGGGWVKVPILGASFL